MQEPVNQISETFDFDRPVQLNPNYREIETRQNNLERNPFMQAYTALQIVYIAVPIIAGVDKFTYFLTDWTQYLAPVFPGLLGISSVSFLYGIGILEIIAGIGVAFRPRIFGYVVAGWLTCIIINMFVLGKFFDLSLRDFGLALGAYALARLTEAKSKDVLLDDDYTSPVIH